MDLPTYTNIWRIEKRLYKLYDFRLPMPLPINWIAVFAGITIPYILLLIAVGLPFNHTLVWLYILPPGVLTWLTTRPVIEGKRLPARPDVVVIDVSFISLKAVLPTALALAAAPMHLLALIKPQFEAQGKHGKGGIIRDAEVHRQVCDDIAAFAAAQGCTDIKVFPSAIAGGDGNAEFFLGARRG